METSNVENQPSKRLSKVRKYNLSVSGLMFRKNGMQTKDVFINIGVYLQIVIDF